MPSIRDQLIGWTETLSDLAHSAEDRYRDGETLLGQGRFRGAVYAFGLAAEMWLKLISYRLLGARTPDPVGPPARAARTFMANRGLEPLRESGHGLRYWAEFVILYCADQGLGLSQAQAGRLRHHIINRLYQGWQIDLRYRPAAVSPEHARRVLADTAWLRAHWTVIGR